ncbi:MAG: DUF2786 domain-containing protein [Acidimicrobiales bacterium]|nr:DUF2786 domain-containing protein [Acidimicrobiales bacterium]MCB9373527.1 DUF2786 domain-containing protein [Microthrixaceae bacterium]
MGTAPDDHPPAPPGAGAPPDPERVLARVRALLAKAESTTFPEEAEALTAKAQELMARHSLDDALASAAASDGAGTRSARPGRRRVEIATPYVSPKVHLLSAVARANRCEAVWLRDDAVVVVFGFEVDLEAVELLFTSLLVQATAAALAAGPRTDRSGRSRTRSFRSSFLVSFAARIGERLVEATAAAEEVAAAEAGAGLVPVLADRSEAVRAERDAAFPRVRTARTTVTNGEGWSAGRRAADRASLDGQGRVAGRAPRALDR